MAFNPLKSPSAPGVTNNYASASAPTFVDSYAAFEQISQGDLVALSLYDSKLRVAFPPDNVASGSALRPAYAPNWSIGGQMAQPANLSLQTDRTVSGSFSSVQLKSGNILHTWITADSAVLAITKLDNTPLLPATKFPGGGVLFVRPWSVGNFVTASIVGGQTQLRIGADSGEQIATQTLAGTAVAMDILQNGNIAVIVLFATGAMSLAIYTPALAAVLAPTEIVAAAAGIATTPGNSSYTQIIPLTGGGFGVAATTNNGIASDSVPRFFTFSAGGIQQGATILGRTQTGSMTGRFAGTALQSGGWAVFESGTGASLSLQLRIFNAAGAQPVATITVVAGTGGQILGNAVQLTNGTILTGWVNGNAAAQVWTAAWLPDGSWGYTTFLGNGSYPTPPAILALSYGAQFGFWVGTGNLIKWMVEFGGMAPFQSDTSIIAPLGPLKLFNVQFLQIPSGHFTIGVSTAAGPTVSIGTYYHARSQLIPIGVAAASAAKDQAVVVQTTGTLKLARAWAAPASIDARAMGGNSFAITGSTINMQGLQVRNKITGTHGQLSGAGALPTYIAPGTARITINCSCAPGVAGAVNKNGLPLYQAGTTNASNDTIQFTVTVGEWVTISTTGGAAANVFIVED